MVLNLSILILPKKLSEAKLKTRSEASSLKFYLFFDANLPFALWATFRSAVYSEIKLDN